jgi:hypothetical protein
MTRRERVARTICAAHNINPDATGWAVTPKTKERLGETYKLWEYQLDAADRILGELEIDE